MSATHELTQSLTITDGIIGVPLRGKRLFSRFRNIFAFIAYGSRRSVLYIGTSSKRDIEQASRMRNPGKSSENGKASRSSDYFSTV